jgi:excisionase family DNA binding protein
MRLHKPRSKVTLHDLLKPEEVADLTGLSVETLAQWRSQKRGIPYLKIGKVVRYDPADVQAYLEGCRVSVSVPKEGRQI